MFFFVRAFFDVADEVFLTDGRCARRGLSVALRARLAVGINTSPMQSSGADHHDTYHIFRTKDRHDKGFALMTLGHGLIGIG